jgi:hypothetical protein
VHWTVNHAGQWIIGAVYVPHPHGLYSHPHMDWRAGSRVLMR